MRVGSEREYVCASLSILLFRHDALRKNQDDTPLHRAFYKNSVPMIQALLKKGGDARKVNKQGMKPGDYAQTEEARALRELALGGAVSRGAPFAHA